MDLVSSALTNALRVGVQVVITRRRPVLEIYHNLRNDYSPAQELESRYGKESHRFQRVFIDLVLVNLGGTRAEMVTFQTTGSFSRELRRDEPQLLKTTIRQMAPGQTHYLMRIELGDLHEWVADENDANIKRMSALKTSTLAITVSYDGELTLLNRILRAPRRWRGLKQYQTTFVFDPQNFGGDLPPPNYA